MTKKFDKQECFMKRGRGGIHEKPIIGGDCLKGGLGQFTNLRGGLARMTGVNAYRENLYENHRKIPYIARIVRLRLSP